MLPFTQRHPDGPHLVKRARLRKLSKRHGSAIRKLFLERLEERTVLSASPLGPQFAIDAQEYDSSSILVRFQPGAAAMDAADVVHGASNGRAFSLVPGLRVVKLGHGLGVEAALQAFRNNPNVVYAEPNGRVQASLIPNDDQYSSLYGMGTIDAPAAWDITTGSSEVLVAVIDTGIDYNHPDLASNIWTNPGEIPGNNQDDDFNGYVDDVHGYDFVGWEYGSGDGDPFDDHYHGTHVAGTIGAVGNNAEGVAGVNWNAKIAAVKFLDAGGSGSWEGAIAAIQYAVEIGAQVSNNSWGGTDFSSALYDAIAAARDHGHLFVAAAGNNYSDGDASPSYPAGYSIDRNEGGVVYEGLDNIIAVAATDSADNKADFSNWGLTSVHLGAPGVDVLSTMPGGGYGYLSGTSMASPHVAGVAALAWGLAGSSNYNEIKSAILSSVDPVTSLSAAGAHPVVTGGRLNALGTVQAVGMTVAGSNPAPGSIIATTPTDFVVNFSHPYEAGTVDANGSDLVVNGIPASSRTLTDSDTVTFHFATTPITAQGEQTMHIAAGAIAAAGSVGLPDPSISEWTGKFRWDLTPMEVVSTTPAAGSSVLLSFTTMDINLNEAVLPSSVQTADLALSQGSVTGFSLENSNKTIRFALAGIDTEGTLSASLAAGALADAHGNPNLAFTGSYHLDIGTVPFPALSAVSPQGSLIYSQAAAGIIGTPADTDSFVIDVAAKQTITVLVTPTASLQPKVTIGGSSAQATGPGKKALLQTNSGSGPQTITVSALGGTTGSYSIQVLLNTALETESHDGAENNSTPQNLDASFVEVKTETVTAYRGAVIGRTDASEVKEVFSTNFDSIGGFAATGMWHQSSGHKLEAGHSASLSMYFGAGEKYQTKRGTETFTKGTYDVRSKGKVVPQSGTLTSPEITLPAGGRTTVDFNYILQTQGSTGGDLAQLQIKPKTGSTWTTLKSYNGVAESSVWRASETVDISAFAGQAVQLRFNFVSDNSQNNFEGWYVDDLVVRQTTPHDHFQFTVAAGERVTVALQSAGDVNVLLQNAAGTSTLATGTSGPVNLRNVISNFGPLAAGTYRLAITGQTNTPYTMVILRGAAFDAESNDTFATAHDYTGVPGVLGHITAGTDLFALRGTPISGDLLLSGSKLTLGIAADGSFIAGGAGIQFVGNEFVIPGSPVAGFTIGLGGANYTNKAALGSSDIPVSLEDLSSGDLRGVRIVGSVGGGLQLERVIAFRQGDQFATIATRLTNTSGAPISNVAWLENLDPDQGEPLGYGFETFNDVVLGGQFVRADNAGGLTIGLGSADLRRVVSAQGFDNRDPFEIINSPIDPDGAFEDIGINLAFNFGTLAAGQSAAGSMIMTFGQSTSDAEATYTANTGGTLVADEDWYKQTVGPDGILHVETSTPGDGLGQQPSNRLNPRIEVFEGSSTTPVYLGRLMPDGRNEFVHETGLAGKVFRIRISAEDGTGGAYFLDPPPPATPGVATSTVKAATSPSALSLLVSPNLKSGATLTTAPRAKPASDSVPANSSQLNPEGVDQALTAPASGHQTQWLNPNDKADLEPELLELLSAEGSREGSARLKRLRMREIGQRR